MVKLHDELQAAELRYDGPMPPEVREYLDKSRLGSKRQKYEAMIRQCAAEIRYFEILLSSPAINEEEETFLNIRHRAETERLKYAEIFLKRYK